MAGPLHDQIFGQLVYSTVRILTGPAPGQWTGSGTGYILTFGRGGHFFETLITNRHVLDGAAWLGLRFHVRGADGEPTPGPGREVQIAATAQTIAFHPDPHVDLASITFAYVRQVVRDAGWEMFYSVVQPNNFCEADLAAELDAVEDVYMVGYPNGLYDKANNLPVVRRGVTASPYAIDYEGRKEFLIDMAVFPGSSGSPVFLYRRHQSAAYGKWQDEWNLRLLGTLYAGPTQTAVGTVEVVPAPTALGAVEMRLMMNLGMCIKAEHLLAFAPPLDDWPAPKPGREGEFNY